MAKLLSFCRYVFQHGKHLRWQGAGTVAIMLAGFVYALIATYGERSGFREAVVSLLILNVLIIVGLLLWGKIHSMLGRRDLMETAAEKEFFAKLDAIRGPFTISAIIDFFNVVGWVIVPIAILTVIWHLFGLT